jgi:hypothetical protein
MLVYTLSEGDSCSTVAFFCHFDEGEICSAFVMQLSRSLVPRDDSFFEQQKYLSSNYETT